MGGSFFGLNRAAKEARRKTGEFGQQAEADAASWGGRTDRYGNLADYYTDDAADYWGERREGGFASPEQITATGREISPWVQNYNQNARDRRASIREREAGRRPASEVAAEMASRNELVSGDVVGNIRDTSGSMRSAVDDTFLGARKDNIRSYGGINDRGETSFADQARNLALIAPGGQAQSARVGRSFAPQVSDTMARMRRSGIDPNSPEAAAMLSGVESNRSRAMDDASANSTESFVRQSNDVSNARLGFMTAADRARLENETSLSIGQVDRSNDIGSRAAEAFQREKLREAGAANETLQWGRSAGMQDVDRVNAITEGDDDQELEAGNLENNQFERGLALRGIDQQTRDVAAGQLGSIGNNYRNSMFQSGTQANISRNAAAAANQSVYDSESANAGWGGRLLGGIAGAALGAIPGAGAASTFARGLGSTLTGASSGGGGGGGGGGQQQGGGGGQQQQGGGGGQNAVAPNIPTTYRLPSYTRLVAPVRGRR